VFQGGWTLAAAEAICNRQRDLPENVLDGLACLLDNSLLYREDTEEPRFAMLETLREYALEQLQVAGELDGMRRNHADYFLAFAEQAEAKLISKERRPWLRCLDREHDNLRAALRWSGRHSATDDTALRLVGALYWFWYFRGNIDEGRRLAEEALQGVNRCTLAAAKALYTAGTLTWLAGDYQAARTRLEQSASIFDRFGDIQGLAVSLREAAVVAMFQHEFETSRALHARSVELLRQAGSSWHLAFAFILFAHVLLAQGDDEGATSCLKESRARFRSLEDAWGVSFALHGLSLLACRHGDYAFAGSARHKERRG
jgi:tetratricopeptide (TPR) repeat protein